MDPLLAPPIPEPPLDAPDLAPPLIPRHMLSWRFPPQIGPWSLTGCSRARHATSFVVPELGLVLDAGARVASQLHEDVFLTHTHSDHIHTLMQLKSRRKPPRLHAPAHAVPLIENYFLAAQELTDNRPTPDGFVRDTSYAMIPREAGDVVDLGRRGFRLRVKAIRTDHSVPSLGYLFFEVRDKLKASLQGTPGHEIAALRKSGESVTDEVERPLFAFLGDTTARVFEAHPELLEMPVVVTECTFLVDEDSPRAVETKHTCWATLRPVVEAAPSTLFVLTHMSLRYPEQELVALTDARRLPNVVWWV